MKRIILVVVAVLSVQSIYAWGKNGHLIVGQLADQYLTPKTREEVKKILGDESVSQAGIWMDIVSKEKEYKNQHDWHYFYKDVLLEENSVVKMEEFSNTLVNPEASQDEKVLALRAVIHISADLHVPMHCGLMADDGGHKGKLTWEESGEKTNMHKVWDTDLIQMKGEDVNTYVTRLQGSITEEQKNVWSNRDFAVWGSESQELLDNVYEDINGKVLTKAYYEQNILIVDDRLGMSAVRLAFLLNSIFDPN